MVCIVWSLDFGVGVDDVLSRCFFFQADDGIRCAQESRGLGDVYKRQSLISDLCLNTFQNTPWPFVYRCNGYNILFQLNSTDTTFLCNYPYFQESVYFFPIR